MTYIIIDVVISVDDVRWESAWWFSFSCAFFCIDVDVGGENSGWVTMVFAIRFGAFTLLYPHHRRHAIYRCLPAYHTDTRERQEISVEQQRWPITKKEQLWALNKKKEHIENPKMKHEKRQFYARNTEYTVTVIGAIIQRCEIGTISSKIFAMHFISNKNRTITYTTHKHTLKRIELSRMNVDSLKEQMNVSNCWVNFDLEIIAKMRLTFSYEFKSGEKNAMRISVIIICKWKKSLVSGFFLSNWSKTKTKMK